jgi:hypothetical protein
MQKTNISRLAKVGQKYCDSINKILATDTELNKELAKAITQQEQTYRRSLESEIQSCESLETEERLLETHSPSDGSEDLHDRLLIQRVNQRIEHASRVLGIKTLKDELPEEYLNLSTIEALRENQAYFIALIAEECLEQY